MIFIRKHLVLIRNTALLRELHTYGQLAPLSTSYPPSPRLRRAGKLQATIYSQHKGLGKQLLTQAEKIAKSAGYDTIAVISGVGVRGYYGKLGYALDEKWGYMVKTFTFY